MDSGDRNPRISGDCLFKCKVRIQDQAILSDKKNGVYGNCLITTYACYLDLDARHCPQIQYLFNCTEPETFWDDALDLWLKIYGYEKTELTRDPYEEEGFEDYYFAWGMSPRGIHHQVIYKEGKLFHDPHPSHEGLSEVKGFQKLTKIN